MSNSEHICQTENIAAYVDGELESSVRLKLEEHIDDCRHCASELEAQRLFMCELDSVLASPFEFAVPSDFAQVVAVHAESDMRGVRDRTEHARAFKFCLILSLAAFALLGVSSSKAMILNAQSLADKTFSVFGLFGRALYDAAAGLVVIGKVFSRGLTPSSRFGGLIALILVALIIGLLSLLISRYHRARVIK